MVSGEWWDRLASEPLTTHHSPLTKLRRQPQGTALFGYELQVVRHVFYFQLKMLFEREQPALVVNTVASPSLGRELPQDTSHLPSR